MTQKKLMLAVLAGFTLLAVSVGTAPETTAIPFPTFGLSSAWLTSGGNCYISCADGSSSSTFAFSTSQCCNACVDACGFGCIAQGNGPAVLCGAE